MKGFYTCLFLFFILVSPLFGLTQDTLHWNPCYKLEMKDFQGKPDSALSALAHGYIRIDYSYKIKDGKLITDVSCVFLRKESWSKYDMSTLHEHEQAHFDIAKLFATKLEERFANYKPTNNVQSELAELHRITLDERNQMDSLFDETTRSAKSDAPQKQFLKKVREQLAECKKKG
jgi:hypothetical protein